MWKYDQASGRFEAPPSEPQLGYSGHGEGLNNPELEAVEGVGPIPRGRWRVLRVWPRHPHLGPLALQLDPVGHDAHGRTEFFIHGDNALLNKTASHGCIILPRSFRAYLASFPQELEVV